MDEITEDIDPVASLVSDVSAFLSAFVDLLPNLAAGLVVVVLTALIAWGVGRGIESGLRRSRSRDSLITAMEKLGRILVWLAGLMITATVIFPNLTPTRMLAGLGLGSIAVGLAFKDIFENFLAGFLILLRKPMRIGDDIICEGLSGRVEHISVRDTFLRERSGELILVPNAFLFNNPVTVLTDRTQRRIEMIVGVAYGEDVDASRDVIRAAVEGIARRVQDRPVDVFAREFNSSSIDFLVRWWSTSAPPDEHASRDEAVAAVKRALDEAGIEIPFPYRTLTFKEPLRLDEREE